MLYFIIVFLALVAVGSVVYLLMLNKKKQTHANGLSAGVVQNGMEGNANTDAASGQSQAQAPDFYAGATSSTPVMNDIFTKNQQDIVNPKSTVDVPVPSLVDASVLTAPEPSTPVFEDSGPAVSEKKEIPAFSEDTMVSSLASIQEPVQVEETVSEPVRIDTGSIDTTPIPSDESSAGSIAEDHGASLFSSVNNIEDALSKSENESVDTEATMSDFKAPDIDTTETVESSVSSVEDSLVSNPALYPTEPTNVALEEIPHHEKEIKLAESLETKGDTTEVEKKLNDIHREISHGEQNKVQIKTDQPEPPEQEI